VHGVLLSESVIHRAHISTFHSTGGTLFFLFIVYNVLIYRFTVKVSVRVRVNVIVKVSIVL